MGVEFQLVVLDHPNQRPDLAPSDLHFFLHLKKHLASQKFHEDKEVTNEVIIWLCVQAAKFCHWNTKKIIPRLNKGLNKGGDYV